MPRWTLPKPPSEYDGSGPDKPYEWWKNDAESRSGGKTLYTHTVIALMKALGMIPKGDIDEDARREVARRIPEVWSHRRDPSSGSTLDGTIQNQYRRY